MSRMSSSFAATLLTFGVSKREMFVEAWTRGIVSKVVKLAVICSFRTFTKPLFLLELGQWGNQTYCTPAKT